MSRMFLLNRIGVAVALIASCNFHLFQIGASDGSVGGGGGTGNSAELNRAWEDLKDAAVSEFKVADGWSIPQLVAGPVNTIGWEDSANISPDGKRLSFAYLASDYFSFITEGEGNLNNFGEYKRGPKRGMDVPFAIDTFTAKWKPGKWKPGKWKQGKWKPGKWKPGKSKRARLANISKDTDPLESSESGLFEAADGSLFYNRNYPSTPMDHDNDLYRDGVRLPFNEDYDDNDPSYFNGELFFWSDERPGGPGEMNIWMTSETGAGWSEPVVLPGPINLYGTSSHQPHITTDGKLYFTSDRDGPHSIWVSERTGDNSWKQPTKVVWPTEGSAAAMTAEPTLTADGKRLYFCAAFKDLQGRWDLDIAYCRRTD